MIVRSILESIVVHCPKDGFYSHRYLTQKDGLGFTITQTVIPPNGEQFWHYKNHIEACLCIDGRGVLTDLSSGKKYDIFPGVLYALNNHDPHLFEAYDEVTLVCVFLPALNGNEIHKEDGSYE